MASKPLLDTNICLDLLLKRSSYLYNAAKIFDASEHKKMEAVVSAISYDTMFYIMTTTLSSSQTTKKLKQIESITSIGPVDNLVITNSLNAGWEDLEDAIQFYTAVSTKCDCVVTRNPGDFEDNSIPILSPSDYISAHL